MTTSFENKLSKVQYSKEEFPQYTTNMKAALRLRTAAPGRTPGQAPPCKHKNRKTRGGADKPGFNNTRGTGLYYVLYLYCV